MTSKNVQILPSHSHVVAVNHDKFSANRMRAFFFQEIEKQSVNLGLIGWGNLKHHDTTILLRRIEKNIPKFPVAGYDSSGFLLRKLQDDFIR